MNGYVEAGYVVGLGVLGAYATSLLVRERAARRRLPEVVPDRPRVTPDKPSPPGGAP